VGDEGEGVQNEMSAEALEVRMAHLEGAYEQISFRLNSIDRRLESVRQSIAVFQWRVVWVIVGTWITTLLTVIFHHS
jgi:hypothetical protein